MSVLPPEIEEADLLLAQAAKMDFVLMRHAQTLALASDDAHEVASLTHAYARASRCMRQNLALLAKQKADRVKAAREADQHAAWLKAREWPEIDFTPGPVGTRIGELQDAVGRIAAVAAPAAGPRAELLDRLDRELEDWAEEDDFADADLDAQVRQACQVLDLPEALAAAWRDLPRPDDTPDPATRQPADAPVGADFAPPASDRPHIGADAPPVPWADSA